MGKKVGIMTLYYKTYNYGAQLQAYALQKVISKLGYECEQISFKWGNYQIEKYYENLKGNKESFRSFSQYIRHSKWIYTPSDIYECVNDYDIFICGSDQIWGVNESMPKFVLPQITLSFVPDEKVRIAYGASMGGAAVDDTIRPIIKNPISKLDAVSVREKSAIPFISDMTEKEVVSVLDPTMLLNTNEWDEITILPIDCNYILVYNIGQNGIIDDIAKILAARLKCKIFELSYSEKDTAGPREFIGLIKNAKYVLTNSFHGTIFSILYHKQFFTFKIDKTNPPYSKNIRMMDLLETFGMQSRFIDDITGFEKEYILALSYENVETILKEHRAISIEFLKKSLEIVKSEENGIVSKRLCYGCGTCVAVCPNKCVDFVPDYLGFAYPKVNYSNCSSCEMCKNSCPALNPVKESAERELTVYAAFNKNENIRKSSSSGGIASALAQETIKLGGVVFGAAYDSDMSVYHSFAETINELVKFRGSKYVQSRNENTYQETKSFLKQGRFVLYIGTPCQIEGLKAYLQRDYENLLTVDFVCNGVGSPQLLKRYLDFENKSSVSKVIDFRFRDKSVSWQHPPVTKLTYEDGSTKIVSMPDNMCFGLYTGLLRQSCYHCGVKKIKRESDITICDFWGVKDFIPHLDDGKGLSVIFLQNQKGRKLFESISDNLHFEKLSSSYTSRQRLMTNSDIQPCGRDYLLSIFNDSTIEKLYYENKLIESYMLYDNLWRNLDNEIKRTELLGKLTKFQMLGCSLDFDTDMKGKIFIYGAGKIGKLACDSLSDKLLGFIDEFAEFESCKGYPVFRLESAELKELIERTDEVTVLVTVPWDIEKISTAIETSYPKITSIVSIEKAVEKIWL